MDAQWAWVPLPGAMLGDEEDATLRLAPRWAELEPEAVRHHPCAWSLLPLI